MLLDYEIAHCTRRCAASGRALASGEAYFSTLHMDRGVPVRRDYAPEAWTEPPSDAVAWWQARVADGESARARLAPNDVLLNLFAALADEPAEAEFCYVLGLLLLRRRLLKLDDAQPAGGGVLVLNCSRRDEQFELRVAAPSPERTAELERRLGDLLYGGAEGAT